MAAFKRHKIRADHTMKKSILLVIMAILMLFSAACTNNNENQNPESNISETANGYNNIVETTENTDSQNDQITLDPDNEYMIISNIDISSCKNEDGYFSGEITFTSKTTQKYVDEYNEYFYRQIYFGFYNENGDLVGDEIAQNNYIYSREYISEESTYVIVSSKYDIVEARVLKIVCEKPTQQ